MKRHRAHACGSDGKIGNDFVEVKTISPEKTDGKVLVKRAGNFNKLLVVKSDENFSSLGALGCVSGLTGWTVAKIAPELSRICPTSFCPGSGCAYTAPEALPHPV